MNDARIHNPSLRTWRVRYIDERTGRLNVRYYETLGGVHRFLERIEGNSDYTPVDYQYWHYGEERWKKYDDRDFQEVLYG